MTDYIKQREAFEKWIQTRKLFTQYGAKLRRGSDGEQYAEARVNGHWMTWQAAQADKLDFARKVAKAVNEAVKKSAFVVAHDENYVSFRHLDIQAIVSEMIGVTDNNKKCTHTPSYQDGDICIYCGKTIMDEQPAQARLHEVSVACAEAEQWRDAANAEIERLKQISEGWERTAGSLSEAFIDRLLEDLRLAREKLIKQYRNGVEASAKSLEKKAEDFATEFGYDDMGGVSFGRGQLGELRNDCYNDLLELAECIRTIEGVVPCGH